jgi:hypothetical protein
MFESSGILKYSIQEGYGYRAVLEIDQDIVDYYYSLVPKYVYLKRSLYPAHISVVRKEIPLKWLIREGHEVTFTYYPVVYNDGKYWWLDVKSEGLNILREELGLCQRDTFHITVGNTKI